jgi:hypothetical protein
MDEGLVGELDVRLKLHPNLAGGGGMQYVRGLVTRAEGMMWRPDNDIKESRMHTTVPGAERS